MAKEQRDIDREAEEAFNQNIIDAVAARNAEITAGSDPDQSGVSGPKGQPAEEPKPIKVK